MSGESDESKGKEEKSENILKVLDDLISHMHTTRHLFVVLIISSLIFAPIAMVVGGFLLVHPRFNIVRFMAEAPGAPETLDRKSTRLNSSHVSISYAVFCLKKKKNFNVFQIRRAVQQECSDLTNMLISSR